MPATLTASIKLSVVAALSSAMDLATGKVPLSLIKTYELTSGTGANQADQLWHDRRVLAASGTEDLDLSGALTNAFGESITLTKVKGLLIAAAAENVNDVVVGGAASNAWTALFGDATDKIKVKPGGTFFVMAPDANGMAVTADTGDLLTVANSGSGTAVTYDVVIIGVE